MIHLDKIARVYKTCAKLVPVYPSDTDVAVMAKKRKISKLFAIKLRKLKILTREGYAPGSWAAK